jgi:hypothetical protein
MSMTRAQIATQLLNEMAPKGEKLAYINDKEAKLLKKMGGAGIDVNGTGIKSYVNFGSGRGSVSESLSQAAFGSSGPTFSSDGGSGSFTPKGNFATITKDKGDIPKGSGAVTAGSLFPKYFKNFQYNTLSGKNINQLRNLAIKKASNNSITDLLKGVLTDPDKFDPDFKRGSQIKASYPQYVKEGILSALGFKPTSQIGGGTNAGRALVEKIGSIPGAKTLGRALPGIGTVSGIYDVGSRLSQGDYFGAGLGALSAVPFAGIPAAAAQAAYDYSRAKFARGGNTGYNNMSMTRAQIATQLLNEMAPKGEKLAYINNREAELLKRMGGAGVDINKTGIKSYFDPGSGRGSVSESLNQAAFGSSGPTFSSDGESGSFTPKGNFATITKDGGGGNDQPITEIRPNFNYNIDPSLIDPRLNFKNKIEAIIYLQEFLDKQAKGEDVDLEADINFRDQLGNLDIFGNLGRSGNIVGANIPFLQSGLASLAYSPDTGLAAGLRGNLTEDLSGGVSFQDGQQNVNFNYNKGPFSADFTKNPEGYDARFGVNYKFAKGGRIGYQMGGIGAMPMIAETPSDVEGQLSDFDLYSTLEGKEGMRFGENPLRIMEAAQRFSKGGEVRQAYGLGKLVKKITKPIQKVVKSDLGKAALTAAAAYYAPALLGKSGYISGANPLFSATGKGGITDFLIKKGLSAKNYLRNLTGIGLPPGAKSTMSPTKRILTALGIGATASPFFMGGEEEDEETLDQAIARAYGKSDLDIPGIRRAALGYSDSNELYFKLPSAYRLNAAEGGITSMDVDDLPMSKEGSPKYYNPEGEEISFKEFEEAMKKEKQIMPKKKPSRTKKAEGGLMNLGGNEMDLRGGGFVPLGAKEKADDVPARLSKNEFVFTADAVRAAGGGSIEKGAQKMYNTMKQLENMV